jgi:preprotein translocase subunit SecD
VNADLRSTVRWLLALLLLGCPERKHPERGVQLVYAKADGAQPREAIERRLARAGVTAHVSEDDSSLTVRIPEGGDVAVVKALLAVGGHLSLCPVDEAAARGWCERAATGGVSADSYGGEGGLCRLVATTSEALASATKGTTRALLERQEGQVVAHAVGDGCLQPRLTAGELKLEQKVNGRTAVSVTLDGRSASELAALTKRQLNRPLLLILDDEVLFAPVVRDVISGGRLMLTLPGANEAELQRLLDAMLGGPVVGLTFRAESRYGPPSLR